MIEEEFLTSKSFFVLLQRLLFFDAVAIDPKSTAKHKALDSRGVHYIHGPVL